MNTSSRPAFTSVSPRRRPSSHPLYDVASPHLHMTLGCIPSASIIRNGRAWRYIPPLPSQNGLPCTSTPSVPGISAPRLQGLELASYILRFTVTDCEVRYPYKQTLMLRIRVFLMTCRSNMCGKAACTTITSISMHVRSCWRWAAVLHQELWRSNTSNIVVCFAFY